MNAQKVKRGLAAILVADVVGFSRLVGIDEAIVVDPPGDCVGNRQEGAVLRAH